MTTLISSLSIVPKDYLAGDGLSHETGPGEVPDLERKVDEAKKSFLDSRLLPNMSAEKIGPELDSFLGVQTSQMIADKYRPQKTAEVDSISVLIAKLGDTSSH